MNNKVFCDYAYDIARNHHEKYNRNAYPDGLKREDISNVAQIVLLVDIYDGLTSKRIYKAVYKTDKAYQMIISGQSCAFSEASKEFKSIV